jgi:uncharacterized protein DUF6364
MIRRRMSKLTLSVDDGVVRQAKRYARARGTSVSRLVERFLSFVASDDRMVRAREAPPILGKLRGSLKGTSPGGYRRHLERKYR